MVAGYIGMLVAVKTNCVTVVAVRDSLKHGFEVSYRGGMVLGFFLTGIGIINLLILIMGYKRINLPPHTFTYPP